MAEEDKLSPEEIDELDLKAENEDELFSTIKTDDDDVKINIAYATAEEALLSMVMQSEPDIVEYIVQKSGIKEEYFLKRKNRLIFPRLLEVRLSKGVCTFDLVSDALQKATLPEGQSLLEYIGGLPELSKIIACEPATVDARVAQGYADIIKEQYMLNKVKEVGRWFSEQRAFNDLKFVDKLSEVQKILSEGSVDAGLTALSVLIPDAYNRYQDRKLNPEKCIPIDTGFYWLKKNRVIAKKRTCVIGARTNIGKSVFASNMITRMILAGYYVLLFTPELDSEEYIDRLLCAEARVNLDDWKTGKIRDEQNAAIGIVQHKLLEHSQNLYIEDRGSQSVSYIISSIKKHMLNHPVDVVVIDYLQKIKRYGESDKRAITEIMERICSFGKDNDIAMIVLSQLRRGIDAVPQMSELKESGDIENLADSVVLLHRNGSTNTLERRQGWYVVAKNREGPCTDNVQLTFNDDYLRFTESNIPQADVIDYNTLIEGAFDDGVADEDIPTEQAVVADIIRKQGTV